MLLHGKFFDAQGPRSDLWEIKTGQLSTYTEFVKNMEIQRTVTEAQLEKRIADSCGYHFVLAVVDQEYYDRLKRIEILRRYDIRLIPGYLR